MEEYDVSSKDFLLTVQDDVIKSQATEIKYLQSKNEYLEAIIDELRGYSIIVTIDDFLNKTGRGNQE